MEDLVRRLDGVMPLGLHILSAAPAVKKAGEVDRAVYEVRVGCPAAVIRDLLAQPEIVVQKRTKKKTLKDVDLRPVLETAGGDMREEDGVTVWRLTLPCNSTESVNPSLLADALGVYTGQEVSFAVRRLQVLDKDGAVFA